MKSFILALVFYTVVLGLGIAGLVYLRSNQPRIWNVCLAALMAPDDADAKTSDSTPAVQVPPVAPPPAERPLGAEIISPTSTFTNSDHVRQVEQATQPSGLPTGPTTNAAVEIAPKEFVPPSPLPAQANWNWNVQGKEYSNVVVTQVEADRVHITYDGGVGTVNTADLTPDLQKLFDYDPQLAAEAAKERTDEQAKIDAQQAPIIAAQEAKQVRQAAADQAQQAQAAQAQTAQERAAVARDQKQAYEDDMQQMLAAHEVTFSTNPQTGAVTYGGTTYWLDKYYADQRAIAQCDQIINSGSK